MPSGLKWISWDMPELDTPRQRKPSPFGWIWVSKATAPLTCHPPQLGVGDTSTLGHRHKGCSSTQTFGWFLIPNCSAWGNCSRILLWEENRGEDNQEWYFWNSFATQRPKVGEVGNRQGKKAFGLKWRPMWGHAAGRWETKGRKDLGLDPWVLMCLFQDSFGTWWESIFKIERFILPVYLGAIQCFND